MGSERKLSRVFPLFRQKAPILDALWGLRAQKAGEKGEKAGVTPEDLNEAQRRLAERFKAGIADALGVPPEAIRQEPVERWVTEFTKAWVSEEYWAQAVRSISTDEAYRLGVGLGEMIATFIGSPPGGQPG